MNLELIKKYKQEFDYLLNGGELIAADKTSTGEYDWSLSAHALFSDYSNDTDYLILINDNLVEFRKALALGKEVEYYVGDIIKWEKVNQINSNNHPWQYRIIYTNFKVGDWAVDPAYKSIHKITKLTEIDGDIHAEFTCPQDGTSDIYQYNLWEPKVDEWCWFYNVEGSYCLCQFIKYIDKTNKYMAKDSVYKSLEFTYCEPFLNALPYHIRNI